MTALLFDMDGVLYVGNEAIPGAGQTLDWVDNHALPHLFLTNTSSRPRRALVDKLAGMGIELEEDSILTPPVAARLWLQRRDLERVALFVPEATREEFSGFTRIDTEDEPVDAVIVGDLGKGWTFDTLNTAFRMLMQDPQPVLLALGMTRYWQAEDGLRLDTAPFVSALSHASGAEPVVTGKPAGLFFEAALETLGVSAGQTLMIGDDINGDIGGARDAGLGTVLVRTGKFREADLEGDIEPDTVLDSIADLPQWYEARPD